MFVRVEFVASVLLWYDGFSVRYGCPSVYLMPGLDRINGNFNRNGESASVLFFFSLCAVVDAVMCRLM